MIYVTNQESSIDVTWISTFRSNSP